MGSGLCGDVTTVEKKNETDNDGNIRRGSTTKVEVITAPERIRKNGSFSHKRRIFKPDEKIIEHFRKLIKKRKHSMDGVISEEERILFQKYKIFNNFEKDPNQDKIEVNRNEIMDIFDRFDKWDFDVLRLEELTNGNPLTYCGYVFLLRHDLFKKFQLDEVNYFRFMDKIYRLYNNSNHFCNIVRACSVLHSFHVLLRKGLNEFIGEVDIFGAAVACFVLYIIHPGLDNKFQEKTEDKVTTLYNDMSTTENVSCYKFVELIFQREDESCAFLTKLNKKQRLELREIVIDLVIASDVETHRNVVKQFKMREENNSDFSSKEDIRVLMQMAFKVASMDYASKSTSQCKEWVKRKAIQQFYQGDVEKRVGYEVSESGRRDILRGEKFGNAQAKFFDYYYKPLLKAYTDVFERMNFLIGQLRRNTDFFLRFLENMEEFEPIYEIESGHVERLLRQQSRITKMFKSIKVPKDQDRCVSIEEQKKIMPRPNEEDHKLLNESLEKLSKRWGVGMKGKREPFSDLPKIYAVSDLKLYKTLSYDDRLNSIMKHFDRIDEWNFDVFCLQKLLNHDVLFIVSWVLFEKYDFINHFKIPRDTLKKFFSKIQNGYQRNPYHNALHATDVMQITNSICAKGGLIEKLSKVDLLAAILSSMVHDYEHPGLNDAYQVHSFSYLAQIYNDRSVLEAHHVAETFRLMRDEGMDIFQNMTTEERKDVRKTMVGMIISTDMCNHARYVKAFNQLIEEESKFKKKKDIRIALQIVIKMADVSNPSRPTYLYLQWTHCIIKEFFIQGDMEKENKLPISPLMDREKSVISKGQMAFMEYVLLPMFKSFASVFPNFGFTLKMLEKNREYWVNHSKIESDFFSPPKDQRKPVEEFVKCEY